MVRPYSYVSCGRAFRRATHCIVRSCALGGLPILLPTLISFFLAIPSIPNALAEGEDAANRDAPLVIRGPISADNQYPFAMYHQSFRIEAAGGLSNGETALMLDTAWTNTGFRERSYTVDAETRQAVFGIDHAISGNFDLLVTVPVGWRGRGILDPVIDGWHRTLGLPQGDRDILPENGYALQGTNADGDKFSEAAGKVALGDLKVRGKLQLIRGDGVDPTVSAVIQESLPTGTDGFGGQGVDSLVGILGGLGLGPVYLHGGVAQ